MVISDDFTGANSIAATLRARLSHVVLDGVSTFADALVLNSRSRDLSEADACRAVVTRVQAVRDALSDDIYWSKRVDSTLRGHVQAELGVLLRELKPGRVVLAPAFPAAGRTTRGGIHFVHGTPIADLRSLAKVIDSGRPVVVGQDPPTTEAAWWIPDLEDDDDVAATAAVLRHWGPDNLIVDTGLVMAATLDPLPCGESGASCRRARAGAEHVLVVQGSGTELVRQQVEQVKVRRCRNVDVLHQPVGGPDDPGLADLAAEAAGRLKDARYIGVAVGGGLTAETLIDALGVHAVEPLAQLGPLQALSRIVGGPHHDLLVATKGGGVGDLDALVRHVDALQAAA